MRTPELRQSSINDASARLRTTGKWNTLPIEARSAFHPHGSAESSSSTTPVAPAAEAERMIAPALPGSWSPAAASTSAGDGASSETEDTTGTRALATTPVGAFTGDSAFKTVP